MERIKDILWLILAILIVIAIVALIVAFVLGSVGLIMFGIKYLFGFITI